MGMLRRRPVSGTVTQFHLPDVDGLFHPTIDQRPDARLDLWLGRHRLHHGLWHYRHDQFRPWRDLYDWRLRRSDRDPGIHLGRHRFGSGAALARHPDGDGDRRAIWLDDRTGDLSTAAWGAATGASDLGDRPVDLSPAICAADPRRTGQDIAADDPGWLRPDARQRRFRRRDQQFPDLRLPAHDSPDGGPNICHQPDRARSGAASRPTR